MLNKCCQRDSMPEEQQSDKKKKLLENANRRAIYNLIRDRPGICFSEIKEKSKLSTGTIIGSDPIMS